MNTNFNFKNWYIINNNGQQNCGIFLHETKKDILMKCGAQEYIYNMVLKINNKNLFPKYHQFFKYNNNNNDKDSIQPLLGKNGIQNYVIMDKLDGDITSILYDMIPRYVLKNIFNDENNKINNEKNINNYMKIFKIKQYTSYNISDNDIYDIININDINIEMYDKFIDEIKKLWNKYLIIIIKEIFKLHIKLYNYDLMYSDFKFDNYGYKLFNKKLNENDTNIKIFDKYFYFYFLDPDSGLQSIYIDNSFYINSKTFQISRNKIIIDYIDELNNQIANYKQNEKKKQNENYEQDELTNIYDDIDKLLSNNNDNSIISNSKNDKIINTNFDNSISISNNNSFISDSSIISDNNSIISDYKKNWKYKKIIEELDDYTNKIIRYDDIEKKYNDIKNLNDNKQQLINHFNNKNFTVNSSQNLENINNKIIIDSIKISTNLRAILQKSYEYKIEINEYKSIEDILLNFDKINK